MKERLRKTQADGLRRQNFQQEDCKVRLESLKAVLCLLVKPFKKEWDI